MPFTPKRIKTVTRTLIKLQNNRPYYFKIEGAMFVGKELKAKEGDTKKKDPATLLNVINLEDGSEGQIIVGTVLKSTLNEEYPKDGYVGRCFEIEKKRDAQHDYNTYNIAEIEDPAAEEEKGSSKKK